MSEITIKVGSVTAAQRGKRILSHYGYHCKIERSKNFRKGDGCGYVLSFSGDREEAVNLLKKGGVKIISSEIL